MLFRKIGEKPLWRFALQLLALAAVSFLQAFQMHYSTVDGIKHFFTLPFGIILLNVGILLWLNLLAKLLLQKWHFSILLTTVLTTVWSIVNFFVLKFHGSPLFFSEFENMGTALNVIDGYKFVWERRITWLLLLGLLGLAAAACNMLGNYVGSGLALSRGSKITRPIILAVLGLLLIKLLTE